MYINKDKTMSELIKLFMNKMSISNYYGREELLQFYFEDKIVKHDCNDKIKTVKNGSNMINVIDITNLIQKTNNKIFSFKPMSGEQKIININQEKSLSDLKKAYFDEIEMPAFYGTNIFVFICGGQCVKLDTNENISKLTNNAIMVLDNPNLIQNDDD